MWLKHVYSMFLHNTNINTNINRDPAMQTSAVTMATARPPAIGLFENIEDHMKFGLGKKFNPKEVSDFLTLKKIDVSRLSNVALSSVRYDQQMPQAMQEHLQEIANTINLVARFFDGDAVKTAAWFTTKNPNLGDVSPKDMIRLGRYDRLRKFIINATMSMSA